MKHVLQNNIFLCKVYLVGDILTGGLLMSDHPTGPKDWEKQNKGKAKDAYEKSAKGEQKKEQTKTQDKTTKRNEADLVKDHKPGPTLTPSGHLRGRVDRVFARERLSRARAQARDKQKIDKENENLRYNPVLETVRKHYIEQEKARENPKDKLKSDYNKSSKDDRER